MILTINDTLTFRTTLASLCRRKPISMVITRSRVEKLPRKWFHPSKIISTTIATINTCSNWRTPKLCNRDTLKLPNSTARAQTRAAILIMAVETFCLTLKFSSQLMLFRNGWNSNNCNSLHNSPTKLLHKFEFIKWRCHELSFEEFKSKSLMWVVAQQLFNIRKSRSKLIRLQWSSE